MGNSFRIIIEQEQSEYRSERGGKWAKCSGGAPANDDDLVRVSEF